MKQYKGGKESVRPEGVEEVRILKQDADYVKPKTHISIMGSFEACVGGLGGLVLYLGGLPAMDGRPRLRHWSAPEKCSKGCKPRPERARHLGISRILTLKTTKGLNDVCTPYLGGT